MFAGDAAREISMPSASRASFPAFAAVLALLGAGCTPPADAQTTSAKPFSSPTGIELDVPYVPTPEPVVEAMLNLGDVDKADYVIDLGSGDGRIAVGAGKRGARAMGVDINPERIAEANANAKAAGVTDRVRFVRQDLFQTPIGEASVLTMYLLPEVNLKLRPVILKQMKPGTRVVSHAFTMGDWIPDATETVQGSQVMMWIVPAQVAGRWTLTGAGGGALELTQSYSSIEGTLGGKPIREPLLRGDRIQFTADTPQGARLFAGRIEGGRVTPAEPLPHNQEGSTPQVPAAAGWRLARAS